MRLSLSEFTLWGRNLVSVVHIRKSPYTLNGVAKWFSITRDGNNNNNNNNNKNNNRRIIDNFIKKLLKSYLQLIRLKKEKTIHSKTLFTISVDLKST